MTRRAQLAMLGLGAAALHAASSTSWETTSYQDFLKGRLRGLSLTSDGRLTLSPRVDTFFASDQQVIWSAARAPDGSVYAATGHRGKLYRIDASGKGEAIWTAEQPEIFAVAVSPRGEVFAAGSPNGKIHRIELGRATEYFAPDEAYVWALAAGPDGALYAATGDRGRVYRIDAAGKGEVWYETGQAHVTALAFDAAGRLLAGTEPNGILYRIAGKGKAFVLYDAALPEIRAIVPAADGSIYAVAMGGSLARRGGGASAGGASAAAAPAATSTISVTVTGDAAQSGVEIKPKPEQAKAAAAPAQPATPSPATGPLEQFGVEKSAVYRIGADNSVETLWSSKEENAYDALLAGGRLLVATDADGRVYRLEANRRLTLIAQTNESEVLRLLAAPGGVFALTGNSGKLVRVGDSGAGDAGEFDSPVHDAGSAARWGRLSWQAEECAGCSIRFLTRSGNSARPDDTWSEWSAVAGGAVASPVARYVQWRAELRGSAGAAPALDSVRLAYLPQNQPPSLKSITVATQPAPPAAAKLAPAAAIPFSITVTDTGEVTSGAAAGTPTQPVTRSGADRLAVSWVAEDPDDEHLTYTLSFRAEGDPRWIELKAGLTEPAFTLDGEALADGRYFFRVVASDRASNAAEAAREDEIVSAPILIDHTPPVVAASAPRLTANGWEIDVEARDALSPLRGAEYSIDAGPWRGVEAGDGVFDSPVERFQVRPGALAPGGHVVVIRVRDQAGNAGLARVALQ
jgi:sugar lactone lactonase YvrE